MPEAHPEVQLSRGLAEVPGGDALMSLTLLPSSIILIDPRYQYGVSTYQRGYMSTASVQQVTTMRNGRELFFSRSGSNPAHYIEIDQDIRPILQKHFHGSPRSPGNFFASVMVLCNRRFRSDFPCRIGALYFMQAYMLKLEFE
jgi:hypothetical protein